MSGDGLPKWAQVQKRTFTNWVNVNLSSRDSSIEDLGSDFSDGLKLIGLLEILSKKKLPKHNREVKRLPQKTENVSIALQFMKDQGIKMVGIGADDIVDGRAKLILGLVWTLIQKYQIQKGKASGGSAKDDLLAWVNKAIPSANVKNFKADWRDGKALCALVSYLKPGSIDLSQEFESPLSAAKLASDIAKNDLSIPALVLPEDLVSDDADDLSIMTYISYFRDYDSAHAGGGADVGVGAGAEVSAAVKTSSKASVSASVSPSAEVSSAAALTDDDIIAPSKCDVYGPGLEAADVGKRNICIIQAIDKKGEDVKSGGASFDVKISGPDGDLKVAPIKDNKDGTYTVVYTPLAPGEHKIYISYKSHQLSGSPFTVISKGTAKVVETKAVESVSPSNEAVDISAVAKEVDVDLSGLSNGPNADGKLSFSLGGKGIKLPEDFKYSVGVILLPEYIDVDSSLVDGGDGKATVSFKPPQSGTYRIEVYLISAKLDKKQKVKGSPFKLNIDFEESTSAQQTETAAATVSVDAIAGSTTVDLSTLGNGPDENGYLFFIIRAGKVLPSGWYYDPLVLKRDDDTEIVPKLVDNKDGSYKVQFKIEEAGAYLVDLALVETDSGGAKVKSTEVKGSPFKLTLQTTAGTSQKITSQISQVAGSVAGFVSHIAEGVLGHHDNDAKTGRGKSADTDSSDSESDDSDAEGAGRKGGKGKSKVSAGKSEDEERKEEERKAEAKREEERRAEEKKKAEAEEKKKAEAEEKKKAEAEEKRKAEAEEKRKAEAKRLEEEKEAEEKRKAEAEEKKKKEDQRKAEEEELRKDAERKQRRKRIEEEEKRRQEEEDAAAAEEAENKKKKEEEQILDLIREIETDLSGLGEPSDNGEVGISIGGVDKKLSKYTVDAKVVFTDENSDVPSRVSDNKDGSYKIFFTPPKTGKYLFTINLVNDSGKSYPLRGTPINVVVTLPEVDFLDSVAQKYSVDPSGLGNLNENGEVSFVIKNADNNELPEAVKIKTEVTYGSSSSAFAIRQVESHDGSTQVFFAPRKPGEYNIAVNLVNLGDGKTSAVNGTPITLTLSINGLENAAQSAEVDLSNIGTPAADGSSSFFVGKKGKKLPANTHYEARVLFKGEEVRADLHEDDGVWRISFYASQSGEHNIHVFLVDDEEGSKIEVSGSPFSVVVVAKHVVDPAVETAAHNTLVDTSDLGEPNANGELGLVLGAPGKRLPYGSKYISRIVFAAEPDVEIPSFISTDSEASYKVVFKPNVSGEYLFDVNLVDKNEVSVPIRGSPFSVNIDLEGIKAGIAEKALVALAQGTTLKLDDLGKEFSDLGEVSFVINFNTKLPAKTQYLPKIVYAQEKSGDIPTKLIEEGDGLRVVFLPPRSGEYLTQVWVVDEDGVSVPVNEEPHSTNITLPSVNSSSGASGSDKPLSVEELSQGFTPVGAEELPDGGFAFLVGFKDKQLPDGYFVDVRINLAADGTDIEARVSDGGEGITRIEFSPPVAGEYIVSAGLVDQDNNGAEIAGSPFTLNVNKPSPEKESMNFANDSFVDFTGFERPRYDGSTSFIIGTRGKDIPTARFHYEPKVICISTGKPILGLKAIDQKNGTFKVSFVPPVSGDYFVEVDLIDKGDKRYTLKGSPFTVSCNLLKSPAPSPMFQQPPKNPALFGQAARKAAPPSPNPAIPKVGTGKQWARPAPSAGSHVPKPEVPPWVQKTGRVWKQPTPASNSVPSPVISSPSAPRYSYPSSKPAAPVAGPKMGAGKKISVQHVPATYTISANELRLAEGDNFDVNLEGPSGALPVDISYKGDALFEIAYVASDAGDHKITFVKGGHVVYEDLITVDEAADEQESIAVAFNFTLESRLKDGKPKTRGGDKFQVKITGPKGPVNTVQVIDQNNGRYMVNYTLPGHGEYDLNVILNGKAIAGSPWKQRF